MRRRGPLARAGFLAAASLAAVAGGGCSPRSTARERRLQEAEKRHRLADELAKAWYRDGEDEVVKAGKLDRAEELYLEALRLYEGLDHKTGIASCYCELGHVYNRRKELDRSAQMFQKAIATSEELGDRRGVADACAYLANVYCGLDDLDRAEEMGRRSLDAYDELGDKWHVAGEYTWLAGLHRMRREYGEARELWVKARDLYAQIGKPEFAAKVQIIIDGLDDLLDKADGPADGAAGGEAE